MLVFFSIVLCCIVVGTLMATPNYEAKSQVLIKIGREDVYIPVSESANPVLSTNREEQVSGEIEILKSLSIAQKVVEELGASNIYKKEKRGLSEGANENERAAEILQDSVKVERVEKSNVIEVRFRHPDANMAARVVNRMVSLYLDYHLEVHKTSRSNKFYEEQSQILKNKLGVSEEKLDAFKQKHQVTSIGEERSLLLTQEADLRATRNETLSEEVETENRIRQLRKVLADIPKTIPQGEDVELSPLISTLQAKLVELEVEEKELLGKYTEESRLVRNVREEMRIVREKLAQQEDERYERSRYGLNATYQRLEEELFRNEAELKAVKAKKEAQTAQLTEYQGELDKLNRLEAEFNELQQDVEQDRQNYTLYLTKFEESRISDAMDAEKIANVTVIEPARPPLTPVSPNVKLNIILGVFLGGLGSLGLAFFLERVVEDRLETTDDVEHSLGLPVLASIPQFGSSFPRFPQGYFASRTRLFPWLATACSLIAAGGIIFVLGHFLGNSQIERPEDESLFARDVVRTKITSQAHSLDQSPGDPLQEGPDLSEIASNLALASVPEEHEMENEQEAQDDPVEQGDGQSRAAISHTEKEAEERTKESNLLPDETKEILDRAGPVPKPEPKDTKEGSLMIQVGAFRERTRAEDLVHGLRGKGYDAYLDTQARERLGLLYLVRVQGYTTWEEANIAIAQLEQQGFNGCFVKKQAQTN